MLRVIDKTESAKLTDLGVMPNQGGSWSNIYSATWHDKRVIVKAQQMGSLAKADPEDDRFWQEKRILDKQRPGMVELLAWGDDFEGERFLVLEYLEPLVKGKVPIPAVQPIANQLLQIARELYLEGLSLTASVKHMMLDQDGNIKLIDFNDDNAIRTGFFDKVEGHELKPVVEDLCKLANMKFDAVWAAAIDTLIETEYAGLDNVHEPIYFDRYKSILRTETDPNDPRYGQRVPANRTCTDRATLIEGCGLEGKTFLDIGCNVGWFCFWALEHGGVTAARGVDFDNGKIDFARLTAELFMSPADFTHAQVTTEFVEEMPEYDVICALSILHLFFTQHNVSKEYWTELFVGICKKAKSEFIFEVAPEAYIHLGLGDYDQLVAWAQFQGDFDTAEIIGYSTEGRPLISCKRTR